VVTLLFRHQSHRHGDDFSRTTLSSPLSVSLLSSMSMRAAVRRPREVIVFCAAAALTATESEATVKDRLGLKYCSMSQSSSQLLEASATFEQAEASWRATHSPHVALKVPRVELPVDRLCVVDSEFEWRHIVSPVQLGGLLHRDASSFAALVLALLLPVARAICRFLDCKHSCDTFFAKVLLGETLWRTQSAMRRAPMREGWCGEFGFDLLCLTATSRNKKDERFASAWRAACGDEASVGHEWMSEFHGAINRLEDLEPFVEASAAFSNNAISLISATSHVVLDDIVLNCTSKTRFPASKKNAHGPEFFAAAVPAPNAGASAIIWTTPRVWRADQGYSTFEIVDQFITMFLEPFQEHAVADRPVLVADSRFLTPAVVYQLLQTPPMPFVGTINTAWYAAAVGKINELATDSLKRVDAADHSGSLTYTAGGKSLYDGHIFSPSHMAEADAAIDDVATASNSATSKKQARSAQPPPSRKSARTSKRSTRLAADVADKDDIDNELDMPDDTEIGDNGADDGPDLPRGALKGEPMWFLEHYTGLSKFNRRRPQYLLSNAIVGVRRSHNRARDPVAPLAGLFSACWRQVDQASEAVKENVMLHGVSNIHKMTESMLYFDFLWSNALNTAFVLAAEARGARVQGEGELYKFDEFGIEVAQLLQKIVTICDGRAKLGQKVCALTF
jgi:hypothetical protein